MREAIERVIADLDKRHAIAKRNQRRPPKYQEGLTMYYAGKRDALNYARHLLMEVLEDHEKSQIQSQTNGD